MEIKNYNSNVQFQAKFKNSISLKDIEIYAIKSGRIENFYRAKKNIAKADFQKKLKVDLCYTDDKPTVIFSRYEQLKDEFSKSLNNYELVAQTEFIANKPIKLLEFGLHTILKLGSTAPNNKMYQKVVVEKGKIIDDIFECLQ